MELLAGLEGLTDKLSWWGLAGKAWRIGSLLRRCARVENGMVSVVDVAGSIPASMMASSLPSRYFRVVGFRWLRSRSLASSSLTPLSSLSQRNLVMKCLWLSSFDYVASLSLARRAGPVKPRSWRSYSRRVDQGWPFRRPRRRSSS